MNEKKLIEKCYEEMLIFLKNNFIQKTGIELIEDENNITDIIHIFTAMRKSKYRDSEKEKEIKQEIYKNVYKCTELKDFKTKSKKTMRFPKNKNLQ